MTFHKIAIIKYRKFQCYSSRFDTEFIIHCNILSHDDVTWVFMWIKKIGKVFLLNVFGFYVNMLRELVVGQQTVSRLVDQKRIRELVKNE